MTASAPPATVPASGQVVGRRRAGALEAYRVVTTAQLVRARASRVPLLFVATFQSVGILLLLRGVASDDAATERQVVAGAAVLVVAFVALNLLAQRFGALRGAGALDHYASLPVGAVPVVLGTATAFAAFTIPGAVLTAVFGALLFGLPLTGLWILVAVIPLAGAGLAGVGALLGLLMPRPELATVAGQLGMSAVLFVGIIPADRMPLVLRLVRALVPSTYATDVLADFLAPHPPVGTVLIDLAVCFGVAVVSLWLASLAYRRAVSR